MGERLHTVESTIAHRAFLRTPAPKWDPAVYEVLDGERQAVDSDTRMCGCCQFPKPRATGVMMGKQWNCRECYNTKTNRRPGAKS